MLIGFGSAPGPAEQALVHRQGGTVTHTYSIVRAIAATIPEPAITALLNDPRVTVIEPDGRVFALDLVAELDNTWGVKRIGAGTVHVTNTGAGVKIGILDSGINRNHPDLPAISGGWDFVNNDNDPTDDFSHGTHVAGTIAAIRNGTGVVGAAPAAQIYVYKTLNANGSGSFSDVISALEMAVSDGVQVTNNSYGSDRNPGSIVEAAFDNSAASGLVHVAAAGNTGNCGGKGNKVGYPAR